MESIKPFILQVNEEQLVQLANAFADALLSVQGVVAYLHGDLGAGKTTFVRAVLRRLGHQGPVKSPTYTLLETYIFNQRKFHHIDLYRLANPEEMEFLGFDELESHQDWIFIEWPQMGRGFLPPADLLVELDFCQETRLIKISPLTQAGAEIVKKIES